MAEPIAILEIDEPVATVIRRFDEKRERMPRPPRRIRRATNESTRFGLTCEMLAFTLVKTKFFRARPAPSDVRNDRLARVLRKRAECRVRELQTSRIVRHLQPCDEPEALRVAFVSLEICALRCVEAGLCLVRDAGFCEPMPDRILTRMSKRRISQIVCQRSRRDDVAKIRSMRRKP